MAHILSHRFSTVWNHIGMACTGARRSYVAMRMIVPTSKVYDLSQARD
jgi:hypothetical protein